MGRTACTEPQCLYKGALYLYLYTTFLNTTTTLIQNHKRSSTCVVSTSKFFSTVI